MNTELLPFNTTRARTHSGPQARESLSQWTEVWPTHIIIGYSTDAPIVVRQSNPGATDKTQASVRTSASETRTIRAAKLPRLYPEYMYYM